MKLLKKDIDRFGLGFVKLQPEEPEDMWHLYNLIVPGDTIRASTVRKVVKDLSGGATAASKVKFMLKIAVEKIEFDAEQCSLRASGKNVEENEHIRMGQYHTIEIEVSRSLQIEKQYAWDSIFLGRVKEACNPGANADLAAVVMQEGLAHVCLLTKSLTLTKARIERRIPKKNQIGHKDSTAMSKFFDEIYTAIERHIDFNVVKAVLVGSPGFMKDDFMQYFNDRAIRSDNGVFIRNKAKFVKAHTTSGHKHAIDEILMDAGVSSALGEVKAIQEVRSLERFHTMLGDDSDRVSYGYNEVMHCESLCAIEELLVTDKLFQSADFAFRTKCVALVEAVKSHGGQVRIFSSMHTSGEKLDLYTGIAAILRFPVYPPEEGEAGQVLAASAGEGTAADGAAAGDAGVVSDDSSDDEDDFNRRCMDGVADMNIFSFA
jgi:protein pelota